MNCWVKVEGNRCLIWRDLCLLSRVCSTYVYRAVARGLSLAVKVWNMEFADNEEVLL
jgi:hypothetical protein